MISIVFHLVCGHTVSKTTTVSVFKHPSFKVRCQDCDSHQMYTLAQIEHTASLN